MKLKVIAAAAILVPAAVSGAPTGEAEDIATGLVCRNDSSTLPMSRVLQSWAKKTNSISESGPTLSPKRFMTSAIL